MTRRGWAPVLPAALVGGALAVAAEVAISVLLYTGPGFIPALSVVLAVLLASLAVGLRQTMDEQPQDGVDRIRRRWLLLLMAFTLAAVFSAGWEVFQGFGARAVTQGVGLVVLAALPLLSGGAVLATMTIPLSAGDPPFRIGAGTLFGAAIGVLVAGHAFFPALSPTAVLLFCLVTLSGAALLHGLVLDRVVWVDEEGTRGKGMHPVRLERWVRGRPRLVRAVLLEGGRLKLLAGEDGRPVLPEEVAVEEGLPNWVETPERILVLGGGRGVLALRLAACFPGSSVTLVDENEALLQAVSADLPGESGPIELIAAAASRLLRDSPDRHSFDLVIGDAEALRLSYSTLPPSGMEQRLRELVADDGTLVLLPLRCQRSERAMLELAGSLGARFGRVSLYLSSDEPDAIRQVPLARSVEWSRFRGGFEQIGVLVAGPTAASGWPDRVQGFLRVPLVDQPEVAREEAGGG